MTKKSTILSILAVCLFTAFCLYSAENKQVFQVDKSGLISFDGLKMPLVYWNSSWKAISQSEKSIKLSKSDSSTFFDGEFVTSSGTFPFSEKLSGTGSDKLSFEAVIDGLSKTTTNEFCISIRLPVSVYKGEALLVDGQSIILPEKSLKGEKSSAIFSKQNVSSLSLPVSSGMLKFEGKFNIHIQDGRFYEENLSGNSPYELRIRADIPEKTAPVKLSFSVSFQKFQFQTLDISKASNMGFRDDTADDKRGGWTDQGPANDLRMMKAGNQNLACVDFQIIDPEKNNGNSCIALAGEARQWLPSSAKIPASGTWRNLYLLHSLAWANSTLPVGKVNVLYTDGTSQSIEITKAEVGDWWAPAARSNAVVAWTGENKQSYVGLYMTKLRLEPKAIESIEFKSGGGPVWIIVGSSLSNDDVLKPLEIEKYIIENKEWKALTLKPDIEKGSALDFSAMQDAPAGKHGFLIVNKDGKFAFQNQPDKAIRFYGANIVGTANFLTKEWAERLAERIAMSGYNAVRLHHFDHGIVKRGDKSSVELDPKRMDQFDYLVNEFEKRGIYITIDLYISRVLEKGELPELPDEAPDSKSFKGLVFVLDSAMDNLKTFSSNLLNHVNPYNGKAWKDDPGITTISLVNEDPIFHCYMNSKPYVRPFFDAKFEEWLKAEKQTLSDENKNALLQEFLIELHKKKYAEIKNFLRALGCKALFSDQNMWNTPALASTRAEYDYVDNHFYWDHPRFIETSWRFPASSSNKSAISARGGSLISMAPTRIFGKPFTVSEFDFAKPNPFCAESGAMTGAYAALQDWDGLYRFAYSHSDTHVIGKSISQYGNPFFDVSVDPVKYLSERMGILLFLRGDAKSSSISIPALVSEDYNNFREKNEYPAEYVLTGLICKNGSIAVSENGTLISPRKMPDGTVAVFNMQKNKPDNPLFTDWQNAIANKTFNGKLSDEVLKGLEKEVYKSSTGELELTPSSGTFKAICPRSESLIIPAGKSLDGKEFSVRNTGCRAVFFAAALDDKKLSDSGRILILHLTNSLFTKTKFGNKNMSILKHWGELPCLIEGGSAEISLKGSFDGYSLYAIDMNGKRLSEIPFNKTGGGISFKAETFSAKEPVLAYEFLRSK